MNQIKGYDIIGDIHGCWLELSELLDKLGYQWVPSKGIHIPPEGRQAIFVGDLTDRGPHSIICLAYVKAMVENRYAQCVLGNHCQKLWRYIKGNKVKLTHGLDKTIAQAKAMGSDLGRFEKFLEQLPYYLSLDDGKLIVVHGAWHDDFAKKDKVDGALRAYMIYCPTRGMLPNGLPDRIDWVAQRQVTEESPWIVYGHQPYKDARIENKTAGIDLGCAFGGKLACMRFPEMELVDVPAQQEYDKQPV